MKRLFYGFLLVWIGIGLGFMIFKKEPSNLVSEACKSPIATYEDPSRIPLRNFLLDEIGDLSGKTVVDVGARSSAN